jgi:hypothetical protein
MKNEIIPHHERDLWCEALFEMCKVKTRCSEPWSAEAEFGPSISLDAKPEIGFPSSRNEQFVINWRHP